MTAQHLPSVARAACRRIAAVLGIALCFALAGGAVAPAAADQQTWPVQNWSKQTWSKQNWSKQNWSKPHWANNSNDWRRHVQWRHNRHHRQCFGSCTFQSRIRIGGSTVVFASPGLVIVAPGFVHFGQPAFVVRQPGFIVRQPGFIVRQQGFPKSFIKRHPSLQQHSFGDKPVRIIRPMTMN